MENNKVLATQFTFLKRVMALNASDVSQKDSLISSPSSGNSVNWIVGHMIAVRDAILQALGAEKMASEEMEKLYNRGTPNVTSENAMDINKLIEMYNTGSDEIIKRLTENELTDKEAIETIAILSFHEAYHTGQIGLFRRLMGKEPKIK